MIRGFLFLLTALFMAGCGRDRSSNGSLIVYSAGPRPLAEAIVETFSAETGISVRLFTATTGQIMARLEAERYRPQADVVILASRVAADVLKEQGRLASFRPTASGSLVEEWQDPDGFHWSSSAAVVGIALGANAPDPAATWEDFFYGRWPGRMVMPSPSRAGTAGDFAVAYTLARGDPAWSAFRAARRGGMDVAAANNQAIASLLMGAYDAILGAADYLIFRQIAAGENVRVFYPSDGGALVIRPMGILRDSPRMVEAEAFVNFYLSAPSQDQVASFHLLPALRGIPVSEVRGRFGKPEILAVSPREAREHQGRILRRFQLEIERSAFIAE